MVCVESLHKLVCTNIDADEETMNTYQHIKDTSMRRRREYRLLHNNCGVSKCSFNLKRPFLCCTYDTFADKETV